MSHKENVRVLEMKYEMFQIACDEGDYHTAISIIKDTKEIGFEKEAEDMNKELKN